ncbi:hypothetical protein KY290_027326 [Solanum tuberosum]|uniref:Uncharacterized protein n=1 Tax=Solanum tuberosum TaxID=4113 RepID=A0ABQ7UEU6_SOLTU|nr:hypothetical protein KY284_026286 [Solanum tuberosum]KAH0748094.1 hypothetical protein KY290_027326 [Solanum tuberosum]
MEFQMGNSMDKSNKNQKVPPRRGQIKIKILKSLKKSAVKLLGKNGTGGTFTPSTTTPGETPSGYDSEARAEM